MIKQADRRKIERAVERFVAWIRRERPEVARIVWFGSWVTGTPRPGSDVDLCLELTGSRQRRMRDRIPRYLPGAFPVGLDLFPYTRDELRELRRTRPELHRALTTGRVFELERAR